jgi:hypothetical protein
MEEILTVLAASESSRATSAIVHFAATINAVAEGGIPLKKALAGPDAILLGANLGGAQALRLEPPPKLVPQMQRARTAASNFVTQYEGDIAHLINDLQRNISAYSRKRKEEKKIN